MTPRNIDPRRDPHHLAVAARDAAILQALEDHFPTGGVKVRAAALAAALEAHRAAVYWPQPRRHSEPPVGSSFRAAALHKILFLDRGRAIGPRHIRTIIETAQRDGNAGGPF
jgi:hypothetical protein